MESQPDREVLLFESEAKSYHRAGATFIKRERPDAFGLPWLKERFAVEAAAFLPPRRGRDVYPGPEADCRRQG